jgi:GxxExxY protein
MPNAVSTKQINRITSTIIDSAIRIHKAIGPGLLEKAYFGCLCFELHSTGLRLERQKALPLVYRGVKIDCAYRADLIVEGLVIVEVKALSGLAPIHRRQLLTYLRIADCPLGVLAKHVVHPEHSEKNGVSTQPFQSEEAPDEASS